MATPMSTNGERKPNAEPVAIAGMGCRWPGGVDSPRQMWSFLRNSGYGFRSFDSASTPRSFSAAGFHHPNSVRPGTTAAQGGFLVDGDPRLFDNSFFGITGREAETFDPSQRKLLEVVYEAFENAGETWSSVAGSNTGVFVGNFVLDHWVIQARDWDYAKSYSASGASPSILANRISHIFDLHGPSVTVDTACSSSMYALHLAVSAIRNGDCDSAIVAASNWIADPTLHLALDKLGVLSPNSRCRTFDASADGYARGEGFAALYLKRLSKAVASESPIRAVIRGTAVNANGRTSGITRPSAAGQEAVIRKAYSSAGLPFSDTTYVECHGTGTQVGDPIELEAISQVFSSEREPQADTPGPLFVGSVKTNMGHTEAASALAAVMKIVLSLEAGEIPPSIGVKVLNPNIDFTTARVDVVREVMPWPEHRPRRASINSFGFGGANAHCIIDHVSLLSFDQVGPSIRMGLDFKPNGHSLNGNSLDKPVNGNNAVKTVHHINGSASNGHNKNGNGVQKRQKRTHDPVTNTPSMIGTTSATTRELVLLPFSAHNESSLKLNIDALLLDIYQHQLADVAYTLSAKRSNLPYRAVRIVSRERLAPGLLNGDSKTDVHTSSSHRQSQNPANVAFVFTGQGAQWHKMGSQLFEYGVFRAAIEHLDDVLRSLPTPLSAWSIADVLKGNCGPAIIQIPSVSQTVCTAVQIGLVDLLASWSVRPVAVAGHSSGEIAAAYASGHATAADAIVAAYLRGQAIMNGKLKGAMLAVGVGPDELRDSGYLPDGDDENDRIQIAAINSPGSITLSGDALAVEKLAMRLSSDGIFNRVLRTGGMAYHSHHMTVLGQEYEEMLFSGFIHVRNIGLVDEAKRYPRVPWVSSVTPDKNPPSSILDSAAYWRANLESPVRFSQAISNLVRLDGNSMPGSDPIKALIEIGPHSALKGPLEQILKSMGQTQIAYAGSALKRGEDARKSILQLVGGLYCLNAKVDLVAVNAVDGDNESKSALVHGRTAIDLPPYQYAYGPINYYESRASKDYRLRKVPRHDLLGSKVPGVAKLRPQWRNVLRIKDLPWLGDHRLLPDAVFPAAGYIAMAIEAALRIYEESPEPGPKPTGYALRNVSINTALRLPEDDQGVEVMLSMELGATSTASASWASFSISSAGRTDVNSADSVWIEHCTGIVKIETGTSYDKPEKIDVESMDTRVSDARSWYKTFGAIGLGYGPTFRPLTNISADPDKKLASATVALKTTAGTVKGGESRYALHPAALDGTFQLGLISCYGGCVETTTTAFIPVHFSRLYIKNRIDDEGSDTAIAVARGEFRGLRGACVNQLQMLDLNGDVILDIEKLRCISYTSETQVGGGKNSHGAQRAFSTPFARMVWKPDFRSVNYQSCRTLFPPPRENVDRIVSIEKVNTMAYYILADVYETFAKSNDGANGVPTPSGNIGHYFAWIKRRAEDAELTSEIAKARQVSSQERHEIINQLHLETKEITESQILKRLHDNMADILYERQTGIDVLIHDDDHINLLSAAYKRGIFMTSAYPQLSRVLDGLAHANPHLRILEVGAGTGGATRVAMKALTGPNGIKRYREYVFTDVSTGFFAAAQGFMAGFRDITYSILDVSTDPATQGYQPLYDVVLASQVLHATANIFETLKNCRKLLKPGGKLVLLESTKTDSVAIGLFTGVLTGFWDGVSDGRINGAFVSLETWDKALKETGFSGTELVLDDYPRPNNSISTVVSTAVESDGEEKKDEKKNRNSAGVKVTLLHSLEHDPLLLSTLCQNLEQLGILPQIAQIDQAPDVVSPDSHVVLFLDGEKDLLLDTEGSRLAAFQHLARNATTLICLTFCGFSKGQNPEGALIPGLLRTIGTENPAGRFVSIDIPVEDLDPARYESEDLARCVANQLFPPPDVSEGDEESESPRVNDYEYVWQDGCLWVSRAVPDDTLHSYAEILPRNNPERHGDDLSLHPLESQGPICAAFSKPGLLSSLYFKPYAELSDPIPSNYIDVKVAAVGVNWKDLAVSSGRFDANNLSSEYAGTVTAVGTDAADLFRVGDRVYGMGRGQFGNYTRVPAAFAQKLDAQDDLTEAATMPLVYMTAVYAFDHLARLGRGHRVLIQSASGGLGLAAIQLAQAKGAEVFAMVGAPEKADFLIHEMNLPQSHVITVSSRDGTLALDKKLLRLTPDGRGFDAILSTGRGDILRASVQALAPLGHLVDVGRTDVQDSKDLGMDLFAKGCNFSSFDLSLILDADPALSGELMRAVHAYYRDGLIGPVRPFSATDISKLDQVLLKFSKGKHVGKLVVTYQDPQALVKMLPAPSQPRVRFDPKAYHIVVGGLGGLGRSIIRWMCQRGARNLVVVTRRGIEEISSAARNLISTLTERGISIQPLACDISDKSQVTRLIEHIASVSPGIPLKGIIHAAVSYLDISFDKITAQRWRDSLAAKVQGTKNLHEITLSLPPGQLDFFVMVTSLESICALATQSAYTAANAFQDAFARYRRRLGLPATSISLGFVKGIGELGQDPITVDMFARNKVLTLSEAEFLACLEPAFLKDGIARNENASDGESWVGQTEDPLSASNILTCLDPAAMAAMEREQEEESAGRAVRNSTPRWYEDGRVSLIIRAFEDARRDLRTGNSLDAAAAAAQDGEDDSTGKLSVGWVRRQFDAGISGGGASQRSETAKFVVEAISTTVAEMLFVDISNIHPAKPVAEHGVDSLIAAELRNWFHQALGAKISMQELLDMKTSIEALAGGIVDAALAKRQGK